MIKLPGIYKVVDNIPKVENKRKIRAIDSGEYRSPKKGEFYLTGAVISAYRAPNDYPEYSKFRIAKLVEVEETASTKIINYL